MRKDDYLPSKSIPKQRGQGGRGHKVMTMLNDAELDILEMCCKNSNMTKSVYIRRLIRIGKILNENS